MSWLFKSLQSDDPEESTSASPATNPAGVKEDLSAIGQTIGRQLRGVAAFLAPPPSPPPPSPPTTAADDSPESEEESETLIGIRNDLAEIGGSFKSGLSLLSGNSNRAVSEISRFASNLLQFQDKSQIEEDEVEDEEDDDEEIEDCIPGITDEVLQFVTEICKRPECWTDFPLRLDHEFIMSDVQREHASTVEQLSPDFAALRLKLCSSMREEVFWMIYFIFLVPRLSGRESELLSTPEIVEARDVLLHKLQNSRDAQMEASKNSKPISASQDHIQARKTEGHDNPSFEHDASKLEVSDKANSEQCLGKAIDDSGNSKAADVKFETEDDISFSDLEDDDSEVSRRLSDSRRLQDAGTTSPNESSDWVQLRGSPEAQSSKRKSGQSKEKDSEGEESSDWLTIDDYD